MYKIDIDALYERVDEMKAVRVAERMGITRQRLYFQLQKPENWKFKFVVDLCNAVGIDPRTCIKETD